MGAFKKMPDRRFKIRVTVPRGEKQTSEHVIEIPFLSNADAQCRDVADDLLAGLGVESSWEEIPPGVPTEGDKKD